MSFIVVIGLLAGAFTTAAFVPQVVKTLRTRSTKDISLGMFAVTAVGLVLWLTYGVLAGAAPVIVANAISLPLACVIIACKLMYR
jgi:MtN3 and saliva related transmembrane protein